MIIRSNFNEVLRLREDKFAAAKAAFSQGNPRVYSHPQTNELNVEMYTASGDFRGKSHVFCLLAKTVSEPGREGLYIGLLMGGIDQKLSEYENLHFARANLTRGTRDQSFNRLKDLLEAVRGRRELLQSGVLFSVTGSGQSPHELAQAIKRLDEQTGQ